SREVHEMFKTTAIDTLKQDKKCQACWYIILSTMSGSTTISHDAATSYIAAPIYEKRAANQKARYRLYLKGLKPDEEIFSF
ncbi:MAG: hypothetical protein WAJ93_25640, partial [Candidatus Nitrosopolaris sp.]